MATDENPSICAVGKPVKYEGSLEFEIEFTEIDEGLMIYEVKRKGLQVGTLTLNIDPYINAKKGKMKLE